MSVYRDLKPQELQDYVVKKCGFDPALTGIALGAAAETGELADYISKYCGYKKFKPGDDTLELEDKIADECADVLVYLFQIANQLGFNLEKAYRNKCQVVVERCG